MDLHPIVIFYLFRDLKHGLQESFNGQSIGAKPVATHRTIKQTNRSDIYMHSSSGISVFTWRRNFMP
jgi:hypothetical protein